MKLPPICVKGAFLPSSAPLLTGSVMLLVSLLPAGAGGKEMATPTTFQWKELWRGHGPAWSPTGAPPGLTIVHTKAAWSRVITAFGPPYETHASLPVDWATDVILFVQANDDTPNTGVHLSSLSRNDHVVTIAAALQRDPAGSTTLGVEVRPWIIASVAGAAFAGTPQIRFTIDGRELPVTHER